MGQFTTGATLAIYKERGALNIQFAPAKTNEKGYYEPGGFLVSVAPQAAPGSSKYDFQNSIKMFIRAEEVTKFTRMLRDPIESGFSSINFYHDPDKGLPNEGTRAKKLSAGAARDSGKFINMECGGAKASVVVSADEISYIVACMTYALPACLGWSFQPTDASGAADV